MNKQNHLSYFVAMNQFATNITINNHLMEICFSKVIATKEKYFVEIINPTGSPAQFEMQKDSFDHWKLLHPVPDWILDLESQLSNIILKSLQPDPQCSAILSKQ